ncbi:hypothetical protein AGMMS49992_05430 [Clostridia bacterium]|nr:hypothetical protein AGMMS49992_05430 [Clostridia bacterium]
MRLKLALLIVNCAPGFGYEETKDRFAVKGRSRGNPWSGDRRGLKAPSWVYEGKALARGGMGD